MSSYISHDEKNIAEMLAKIGVSSLKDLYKDIPEDIRIDRLNIPEGLSEPDLYREILALAEKNHIYSGSFLGAGSYFHYIPTLVDFVLSRSEFYTAYTPYQAEMSQGYLQAIFEYQSAMARLTGMDVSNASMYDGATALAEAAVMSTFVTKKKKVLYVKGVHPNYIKAVETYCWPRQIVLEEVSIENLESVISPEYASVLIQSPNFFGEIEDLQKNIQLIKVKAPKCLVVQAMSDPTCLGELISPGELGVDIFVAEGQSLGIAPSFGGPGLGIFAVKKKLVRKMPGRLIGMTKELNGTKDGFVLTLQAREQHIRREKATSNICSNQALCMLAALVYLVSVGKNGLKEVASQNFRKASYVKAKLAAIQGYKMPSAKPIYNEFVVECPHLEKLIDLCKQADLLPPLRLSEFYPEMKNQALVCVTETATKAQIDQFLKLAEEATL